MESLPLLPGYVFSNFGSASRDYKLRPKLKYSNGFPVIRDNYDPKDNLDDAKYVELDPTLIYGRPKPRQTHDQQRFIPHHVLYARKCLSLDAYFKQGIFGSPDEFYRIRKVNIIYYLEDDTMAVMEPTVKNAGFKQGKLVKRHKIPRPDRDDRFYCWKDLNVAMNLEIYGIVYRVIDCDAFTREFLLSQGIDVSDPESLPPDPYLQNRTLRESQQLADLCASKNFNKRADDRRHQFLKYDGLVLNFDALWNDEHYKIRYFMADDTIAISKAKKPNEAKDMEKSLLLKRTKIPKNWKDVPIDFPGICLEKSDDEYKEFYSPSDLKIGETIFIFGRRFLLFDCDSFTRSYYHRMLRIDQPSALPGVDPKSNKSSIDQAKKQEEKKSKDLIRKLYNFPKRLRYRLIMDAVHPEDCNREFLMEYGLADGAIRIYEIGKRNSGRQGGCFLGWNKVPKPKDLEQKNENYYTPENFYIGEKLNIFGHWFVITGTELFVYKYMKANPQKFKEDLVRNIEKHLREKGLINENECTEIKKEDEENKGEKNYEGEKKMVISSGDSQESDKHDTIC